MMNTIIFKKLEQPFYIHFYSKKKMVKTITFKTLKRFYYKKMINI